MSNDKKLREAIISLFESKLKKYNEITLSVWLDQLRKYPFDNVIFGIRKLIEEDTPNISIGKILSYTHNLDREAEIAWQQALDSAICGGNKPIRNRVARSLNNLGGMGALRNATKENPFYRKDFIAVYKALDYSDNIVRCTGQNAEVLPDSEINLLDS